MRNIAARIDLGAAAGKADRIAVEVPEIRLRKVGSAGAGGISRFATAYNRHGSVPIEPRAAAWRAGFRPAGWSSRRSTRW